MMAAYEADVPCSNAMKLTQDVGPKVNRKRRNNQGIHVVLNKLVTELSNHI